MTILFIAFVIATSILMYNMIKESRDLRKKESIDLYVNALHETDRLIAMLSEQKAPKETKEKAKRIRQRLSGRLEELGL